MIQLNLHARQDAALKVLCLGSHSDDIEIGCGGTLLRLAEQYPNASFSWVVFNAIGARRAEAERGLTSFIPKNRVAGAWFKEFPDTFMPFVGADVKSFFDELKGVAPDIVFTHYGKDAHQDHRLISELTWNAFRDHLILEYEIPKYDGDMGQPSVFVPLTEAQCQKKVRAVVETFESQRTKRWFEEKTFFALMRLRGMECNAPSGYAEAFFCRKLAL
jgi:LmbE family N-acetylglucosaminyl deacetylase